MMIESEDETCSDALMYWEKVARFSLLALLDADFIDPEMNTC